VSESGSIFIVYKRFLWGINFVILSRTGWRRRLFVVCSVVVAVLPRWVTSRRGRPCLFGRPNPNKGGEQRFVG